jgi:beta-lactamase regulating signal transducer with metallopeptidase domain
MTSWLLHTLIATSGLILVVLILREPVRKQFGSRAAYGLWLIPAARLFMPTVTHTVERSVPAATPLPLFVREPVWMSHVAAPAPSVLDRLGGWPTLLFVLWLGVASGLFISRMVAFHRDRRALLRSSVRDTRLGAVRLVHTPGISSPVALGILSPIIAVPADFQRLYGERERRLVLEHELAHHRSGDLVANLFAFVLLCLQWFNPLAWVAHAAFRFDQEAACDARVLDKAPATDRASYGRAIAKAASGRALLFASALDRPTSLQRRLQSMVHSPSPSRRNTGRLLVILGVAAALPLTASHAIAYIDPPGPAAAPASPIAPTMTAVAAAAAQPIPAAAKTYRAAPAPAATATKSRSQFHEDMTIDQDFVVIDGQKKRWQDLTPAEFARVKTAVAKARTSLANTYLNQAQLMRDLANLPDKAQLEQLQRQLSDAQVRASEALRRIAQERAAGRDPDGLEAAISERLAPLRNVDLRGLAMIDRQKLAADVGNAAQGMENAKAELARIQARIDADPRN